MPTIEISDKDQKGFLSFDLIDVLEQIEPLADKLEWYFIEFELGSFRGTAEGNVQPWVLALWHEIQKSKIGVSLSWETLKDFARNVIQTVLCLVVAVRPGGRPPSQPLDPNSTDFEIVVQAVDADLWAVTTSNQTLISQLEQHFSNTQIVEKTRLYY